MNFLLKLSLLSMLFLASCGNETALEIRVKNVSEYDFDDIQIMTSEDHDYGNLSITEVSDYQIHETAYSYCYVKLAIGIDTFIIQPTDFVGEPPLVPGRYTYEINAGEPDQSATKYDRLTISARED